MWSVALLAGAPGSEIGVAASVNVRRKPAPAPGKRRKRLDVGIGGAPVDRAGGLVVRSEGRSVLARRDESTREHDDRHADE